MDRRKSLKAMVAGTVTSGFMFSACLTDSEEKTIAKTDAPADSDNNYDTTRTVEELAREKELRDQKYFNDHELETLTVLADIIIPAEGEYHAASEVGVVDFIAYIVLDMPHHQLPLRGGIMWIDHESNKRYNKVFKNASKEEQIAIVDDIAYPEEVKPEHVQGERFFSRLRDLVSTGYFTSKEGIEYLGYVGNTPNVWDGVPDDVLSQYNMKYDQRTLDVCIKPEERQEIANWDNYEV
ncbi:gluconate 2-dehydrogenase subunit 3 family protein [Galbibacter pacificus]|uniref:Gluconate 2-dehydrogenase subunit 3 family protein n=1 Tax=Galbibacter pacificus TaxID=2996052 RepID=A0ABT6FSK2_9FLAO|nr:gluconate 2-dehydrogenase subunit 3 family protein [Galbibacter pacificus]MDG3582655.1 gluconate 2-dehydrogenase subunit 3 family protein [Galbibacter pacificus]MDG3586226.1 gluconate 2-dehydrogenase subunit 3 family protein [Galbibacter pacificus]